MLNFLNRTLRRLCSRLRWPRARRVRPRVVVIKKFGKTTSKPHADPHNTLDSFVNASLASPVHPKPQFRGLNTNRPVRIATFNAASFSMAPAVPYAEKSNSSAKFRRSLDSSLRTNSVNDRPKSILKQSPLHPNSVNGVVANHNLHTQPKFVKPKPRVSINLPDNEISLLRNRQASFSEYEMEKEDPSSSGNDGNGMRIAKSRPPLRSIVSMPSEREKGESYRCSRTVVEVLRELDADILALQDVKAVEEKGMRPLSDLADALGMKYVFAESWAPEYGNAVLSRWPIKRWKVEKIFDHTDFRNVLKATIDVATTVTMVNVPNIKLNSGFDMPQIGFGLWKVDDNCADVVYEAIKAGYRLLDGACDYGNEKACGEGVARAIKDGIVKREELFIVSKLWQTYHDKENVEPITRKQLADWQIDYFDLFLIHFPVALEYVDPKVRYPPGWHYDDAGTEIRWSKATNEETWGAMEGLVEKGLAKSIGISNFQAQSIYDLLKYAKIRPATLQVELHPYHQQTELVRLAKAEGIALTAYSSFGPAGFMELDMDIAKSASPLMQHEVFTGLASKYNKTAAQVLLRWATQQGLAVIPKSTTPEYMAQNFGCVGWDIDEEDMKRIARMNLNLKFNKPTNYFPTEKLWIFA